MLLKGGKILFKYKFLIANVIIFLYVVLIGMFVLEFKKPLPTADTEEPTEKRKIAKPRRPKRLLGDIIKEANANKKYYMGR